MPKCHAAGRVGDPFGLNKVAVPAQAAANAVAIARLPRPAKRINNNDIEDMPSRNPTTPTILIWLYLAQRYWSLHMYHRNKSAQRSSALSAGNEFGASFASHIAVVGVNQIAAQYEAEIPSGFRFQLINGDVNQPRPYATVEVLAQHGGYEFSMKANEGASELELLSVEFIGNGPWCTAFLLEMAGRAIQTAPDPRQASERMLRMDCGEEYPVRLRGKYEGSEAGGATFVISIWNAAVTPTKRVATLRVETLRGVNHVEIEDGANAREQTAVHELRDRDAMRRALATP